MNKRTLVVGAGSIGKRRADVLRSMGHEVVTLDPHSEADYPSFDFLDVDIEAAVICTPPDSGRMEQIHDCVYAGAVRLFVEKPIAMSSAEAREIAQYCDQRRGLLTMGACNMRFAYAKTKLAELQRDSWKTAFFYMKQAGHLWSPEHRPIELILDSIHEVDLAAWVNGPIVKFAISESTVDHCTVVTTHANAKRSAIVMDRITDPPVRKMVLLMPGESPIEIHPMTEDMYRREMEHFLGPCSTNPLARAAKLTERVLKEIGR